MDDSQRLDALGEYGLCLAGHQVLINGEWFSRWTCDFGIDQRIEGDSIRDVIDRAVQRLQEDCLMPLKKGSSRKALNKAGKSKKKSKKK